MVTKILGGNRPIATGRIVCERFTRKSWPGNDPRGRLRLELVRSGDERPSAIAGPRHASSSPPAATFLRRMSPVGIGGANPGWLGPPAAASPRCPARTWRPRRPAATTRRRSGCAAARPARSRRRTTSRTASRDDGPGRHGEELRPRRRGRRHQRPLRGAFLPQAGRPRARVLMLDNHDDFGGHARRNEFRDGATLHQLRRHARIDSPRAYSAVAKGLIAELGIDVRPLGPRARPRDAYAGPRGRDLLRPRDVRRRPARRGPPARAERARPQALAASAAVGGGAAGASSRLETEAFDPWPELASAEKKARLRRMSYADFLTKTWSSTRRARVLPLARARPVRRRPDAISALDGWGLGFPASRAWSSSRLPAGHEPRRPREPTPEEYFFHYPDGNAIVARLLVRTLIPPRDAGHGRGRGGDRPRRLRAARRGRAAGAPAPQQHGRAGAERRRGGGSTSRSTYLRRRRCTRCARGTCVLACWNAVIPHLCPELPEAQTRGARVRGQGAARVHERVRAQLAGVEEARACARCPARQATGTRCGSTCP